MKGYLREKMRALRNERGNCCLLCSVRGVVRRGKPNLEFAHLAPTNISGMGRGMYRRIKDIIEHPRHYVLICKVCHRLFDMPGGLIGLDDVMQKARCKYGWD